MSESLEHHWKYGGSISSDERQSPSWLEIHFNTNVYTNYIKKKCTIALLKTPLELDAMF